MRRPSADLDWLREIQSAALVVPPFIALVTLALMIAFRDVELVFAIPALVLVWVLSLFGCIARRARGEGRGYRGLVAVAVAASLALGGPAVLIASNELYFAALREYWTGDDDLGDSLAYAALAEMDDRVTPDDLTAGRVTLIPPRVYLDRRYELHARLANGSSGARWTKHIAGAATAAYAAENEEQIAEIERVRSIAYERPRPADEWDVGANWGNVWPTVDPSTYW